jgi:hypothetical protein
MELAIAQIHETSRKQVEKENKEEDQEEAASLSHMKEADFQPMWKKLMDTDPKPGLAVIVDAIIIFAHTVMALLYYFICMIEVLQHHRVMIKVRKTRFFPPRAEFVGVNITREGNSPAVSKYDALRGLGQPILYTDLSMLIGFIGFYRNWIPLYESRTSRWRDYQKKRPAPGTATKKEEAQHLRALWTEEDDTLLKDLKQAILNNPVLQRPVPNRRFYLKTDWSALAQGAVLLQAGCSEEEEVAMMREIDGEECNWRIETVPHSIHLAKSDRTIIPTLIHRRSIHRKMGDAEV